MELREILCRYKKLSHKCLSEVERHCELFIAERGEDVVRQGSDSHHIYFLASGTVRVGLKKGRKEDTVCFGGGGDVFFSLHAWWSGEPAAYSLGVLEACSGWKITFDSWRRLEQCHPELVDWMRTLLAEQLYSFERLYRSFAMTTPAERLSAYWDSTPASLRNIPPAILSRVVPLKYVAQYLGMAQQTLSLLRRRLVGK